MIIYNEYEDKLSRYVDRFIAGTIAAGHAAKALGARVVLVDGKFVYNITVQDEESAAVFPGYESNREQHENLLASLDSQNFEPSYLFFDGYPVESAMSATEKTAFVELCLLRTGHTVGRDCQSLVVDMNSSFLIITTDTEVKLIPYGEMTLNHRKVLRDLNVLR